MRGCAGKLFVPSRCKHFLIWICGLLVLSAFAPNEVHAQALEPRAYVNIPVGLNFLVASYIYSDGGILTDPSVSLENASIKVHGPVLAYARGLALWGKSGKFDMILPYACASGSAEFQGQPKSRDICGLADPSFRLSINLSGAPALSLKEFADYEQDFIVGVSLQVAPPLGQYDPDKLINIGTNRWYINPEIGISQVFGPMTLELTTGVTFYTSNDDFFGGNKKDLDPIYSTQGHLIYNFSHTVWGALNGTFYRGGASTVDGIKGDDLQRNTRLGATLSVLVNRYHSLKLYSSTGVATRTGTDFDTVGFGWRYRWGAGL
jgi:hypothetical protein